MGFLLKSSPLSRGLIVIVSGWHSALRGGMVISVCCILVMKAGAALGVWFFIDGGNLRVKHYTCFNLLVLPDCFL